MRLIIDTLVALTLVGVLGGIALHSHREKETERRIKLARRELQTIQSQVLLQSALEMVALTRHGYPATIDPAWFGGSVPGNPLLKAGHEFVSVASEAEAGDDHPRDPMATSLEVAQFWYNPYKGVVRARVPDDVSEATALRLYNRVNDSHVTSLTPQR
jgi:hypothetical protein